LILPAEYGVHDTFNVIDLTPFVGNNEEEEALNLRTNPFQEGGDDGRGPNVTSNASPPKCRIGPTTRAMAKKLKKDWDTATDDRETFLYMFKMP